MHINIGRVIKFIKVNDFVQNFPKNFNSIPLSNSPQTQNFKTGSAYKAPSVKKVRDASMSMDYNSLANKIIIGSVLTDVLKNLMVKKF